MVFLCHNLSNPEVRNLVLMLRCAHHYHQHPILASIFQLAHVGASVLEERVQQIPLWPPVSESFLNVVWVGL